MWCQGGRVGDCGKVAQRRDVELERESVDIIVRGHDIAIPYLTLALFRLTLFLFQPLLLEALLFEAFAF